MRQVRLCSDCGINIDLRHNRSIRCEPCQDRYHVLRKKTYYKNNRERMNTLNEIWRKANPDKIKARMKTYYETNCEKIKAYANAYNARKRNQLVET